VNCDPIARWYWWLEYIGFGGELQRRRTAFLAEVASACRALVLGEGDGRFLVNLVKQNQHASIDYIDISERMLELARARTGNDRVAYHCGNALTLPLPTGEYDLVTTHFFLDCLNDEDAALLVDRVSQACAPNAFWLISEFQEPNALSWLVVRFLYFFFRLTTGLRTLHLVDHRPLLAKAGFRLKHREAARFGMLVSELWTR
jgi:ubiquinone/menaquinone biosynthesis C-methylase UbiE